MILNNVKLYGGNRPVNIIVDGDRIADVPGNNDNISSDDPLQLHFNNVVAFPGFINSHDYNDLGKYTLKKYREDIDRVLKIPLQLRVLWGIYKNLLCGITTVINHGQRIDIDEPVINVFQNCHCLHSVEFEKNWKYKLNGSSSEKLFVIHIGEGKDAYSKKEIDKLIRWNLFRKNIIGVHGIAMTEKQAESFKALVWCPASNYFMFNETARVDILKENTSVIFGTDSTLTAGWNLWDHLRQAKEASLVNDEELFSMLTLKPATVWGFGNLGAIEKNKAADIVIAKSKSANNSSEHFFKTNPEDILLIVHNGSIKLFDSVLLEQLQKDEISKMSFSKIIVNGSEKYVYGDLPALIKEVKKYYPEVIFPIVSTE